MHKGKLKTDAMHSHQLTSRRFITRAQADSKTISLFVMISDLELLETRFELASDF